MQPLLSKVFTSLIRNRLYTFAADNGYIQTNIQKGFREKISGCVELVETLTHIINNARIKQRGCAITLLDLKNAVGEVNNNLLVETLKIHHIPDNIITLITSLYTDYTISIITDTFMTSPIKVQRGALQGDSLPPLLFNLIVNTLINTIKSEKVACKGYVYNGALSPKHWFQFADDTAIVTALERDNQLLCNAVLNWSTWADLIICVDKCHTFGMKKSKTKIIQFQPFITLKKERIPPVKLEDSFTYLGKDFNFNMNCDEVKNKLKSEVLKYILTIDKLPLKCPSKIDIVQRHVFSKLKWCFSICNISETWVAENIDNEINRYYRKWLQIPISGNITHLSLPKKMLGLNIKTAQQIQAQC